jgi:hypothetical protein
MRRWPSNVLAPLCWSIGLVLLSTATGCEQDKTFVTPLQLVAGSGERCLGDTGVDTIMVDVLRYEGSMRPASVLSSRCRVCATEEAPCTLVSRHCLCVGKRTSYDAIGEAIAGLRFDEIPPNVPICIRLIGIDRELEEGPASGPGLPCERSICDEAHGQSIRDSSSSQIAACMLSPISTVAKSGTPIVLDDVFCGQIPFPNATCEDLQNRCSATRIGECVAYRARCTDAGADAAAGIEECVGF